MSSFQPKQVGARGRAKVVSEASRERETFKYDPYLTIEYFYESDGNTRSSSELVTAPDSTLTALAQLGAYQTGTDRAFISLFDANYQYIVAETAPSMPIAPALPGDKCIVPLALRGTAIPRDQGTCDHVLFLKPSPDSDDQEELPLSFVPNLADDARFTSRPYCQFGEDGQFYAAVPIRTGRGINIGAYCVMSPVVPPAWNDNSKFQLQEISRCIMDYLDRRKSSRELQIQGHMNRGIGAFINGESTLQVAQNTTLDTALQVPSIPCSLDSQPTSASDIALREPGHVSLQERSATSPEHALSTGMVEAEARDTGNDAQQTFSRAANLMRQALDAEGCFFVNVSLGSFAPPPMHASTLPPESTEMSEQYSSHGSSTSGDESSHGCSADPRHHPCEIIGASTKEVVTTAYGQHPANDHKFGAIPSGLLAKLLRRYPKGKIFNYDALGELQSSDSSDDETGIEVNSDRSSVRSKSSQKHSRQSPYSRCNEGSIIQKAFPTARSVVFVPVWDAKQERWSAGGFLYTLTPTQPYSAVQELTFFRAFAMLITSELLRLQAIRSDNAKSDVMGSLSHELRSPLHGILLSTELLSDSNLSITQGNTMHTIETCCRTLLDTIDHLLDYSKINASWQAPKTNRMLAPTSKRTLLERFNTKQPQAVVDLSILVEEAVDSVFAGFNFQRLSVQQVFKRCTSELADAVGHIKLDQAKALEYTSINLDNPLQEQLRFTDVSIHVAIDPSCDWFYNVEPGAIRRIVMNLVGNSLKYTASGYIYISLTQPKPVSKKANGQCSVELIVQDTGKGISKEYLEHNLFKPFCQEDELAAGTGMGLSLVKSIVSQLGGQISVQSQRDVGTKVTVTLPLKRPLKDMISKMEEPKTDAEFEDHLRRLNGLRVHLSGFQSQKNASMQIICESWLKLGIAPTRQDNPHVIIWLEDALPTSYEELDKLCSTPNVAVCQNALVASERSIQYQRLGLSHCFEFVSQPMGPRKLGKAICSALNRGTSPPTFTTLKRPTIPRRAHSSYDVKLPHLDDPTSTPPPVPVLVVPASVRPPLSTNASEESTSTSLTASTPATDVMSSECLFEDGAGERKFLLVDDNRINLNILSAYMKKLNRQYEAVSDGRQAVDAYVKHPTHFQGVLMDISMPIMNGLEATRQIRAFERKSQIKAVSIIALTGLISSDTKQEAFESGVDVYLTKPVGFKTLREVLEATESDLSKNMAS